MKADYKNWMPKGMVTGTGCGTIASLVLFLILWGGSKKFVKLIPFAIPLAAIVGGLYWLIGLIL